MKNCVFKCMFLKLFLINYRNFLKIGLFFHFYWFFMSRKEGGVVPDATRGGSFEFGTVCDHGRGHQK